jgi:hypothetical protein
MAVHRNCDGKKCFRNDGRQSEDEINMAVVGIREERPSIHFTGNDILRDFDLRCRLDSASRVRQRFRG